MGTRHWGPNGTQAIPSTVFVYLSRTSCQNAATVSFHSFYQLLSLPSTAHCCAVTRHTSPGSLWTRHSTSPRLITRECPFGFGGCRLFDPVGTSIWYVKCTTRQGCRQSTSIFLNEQMAFEKPLVFPIVPIVFFPAKPRTPYRPQCHKTLQVCSSNTRRTLRCFSTLATLGLLPPIARLLGVLPFVAHTYICMRGDQQRFSPNISRRVPLLRIALHRFV